MAKKKTGKLAKDRGWWSSYWFDDAQFAPSQWSGKKYKGDVAGDSGRTVELIRLSAFMRSATNFVRILTKRHDINVRFAEGNDSYTDGKTVTLSADVEGNFDSTVGLALHEGSHIVLTDFNLLREFISRAYARTPYITKEMIDKVIKLNPEIRNWDWVEAFGRMSVDVNGSYTVAATAAEMFLYLQFKDLINWIEDRRIDTYVKNSAPGYCGYYDALYNRYFYSDEITAALKENKSYNTETLDSYMYQIINSINPASDSKVLKGMADIKKLIDVKNISRFKNTTEVAKVASDVLGIIMDNIKELDWKASQMKKFGQSVGQDGISIDIDSLTDRECKKIFGMDKETLRKLIEKSKIQRDFVGGNVIKVTLNEAEAKTLDGMKTGGASIQSAGGEEFSGKKVKVLLVERISDALMDSPAFSNVFRSSYYKDASLTDAVNQGFILGNMLGSRLQVRNEERSLKYTRQENGKLDKRLIASLGYGAENVFSRVEINRYGKAHIHISVDASGSMQGDAFARAIKTTVALAVASKMTNNIECVISFRTTQDSLPCVFIGYDSRHDNLASIRHNFPRFAANGSTPESLCYEAMMEKVFPKISGNDQFFFVNMSDGGPGYHYSDPNNYSASLSYGGESAYAHCRRMINKMIANGATVISYLITDCGDDLEALSSMYGAKNAFNVNTDNIEAIARVMNKKFLEASGKRNNDGGAI